jgi:hypothetical protein
MFLGFLDIEFEESIEGCLMLSAPRRLFAFRNQDIFEIGAFGFAERAPLASRCRFGSAGLIAPGDSRAWAPGLALILLPGVAVR